MISSSFITLHLNLKYRHNHRLIFSPGHALSFADTVVSTQSSGSSGVPVAPIRAQKKTRKCKRFSAWKGTICRGPGCTDLSSRFVPITLSISEQEYATDRGLANSHRFLGLRHGILVGFRCLLGSHSISPLRIRVEGRGGGTVPVLTDAYIQRTEHGVVNFVLWE